MNKFTPKDSKERQAILSIPIITDLRLIKNLSELASDWILVGGMEYRLNEWAYDFNQPMNCTAFSHTLGLRR